MDSIIPVVQGLVKKYQAVAVAAGAETTILVPVNTRWRLKSVVGSLVCDANIAARTVSLVIDDGSVIVMAASSQLSQTAGLTRQYAWNAGAGGLIIAAATAESIGLPVDLVVVDGQIVRTQTLLIQAGDQWSQLALLVEEWIQG